MGLDMYVNAVTNRPAVEVDFTVNDVEAELHYWRKHPNLHGWMERLYLSKGGTHPEFNGTTVLLTPVDIDLLEIAITKKQLPETDGFFFGASDGTEITDDLAFITKARAAFANGLFIYYCSSW